MANTPVCANCGHVHPSNTASAVTRISGSCDQCGCNVFRHARGRTPADFGQLSSNDTPGHALATENATLKQHITELRRRLPETDGSFASKELDALRTDAHAAHEQLSALRIAHRKERLKLERANKTLGDALADANLVAASLLTIANSGYSAYTHPAVVNGVRQITEKLSTALGVAAGLLDS